MNTIPLRFWNTIITTVWILAALMAVFLIKELKAISYVGKDTSQVNTISVSGEGETYAKPDVATFSFTVEETAANVADAQAKATTKNNAAQKALTDAGVSTDDVKTTSYNISPHYEYQTVYCGASSIGCVPNKSVLTGYDVSQTTSVKVRDITKAGTLFSTIGSLGVQNVNDLSFSVDNMDAVQALARTDAINKAEAKAKELAKELGVTIVRVNSFEDQSGSPSPIMYGYATDSMSMKTAGATAPVAPDVAPGQNKITDNVTITYEIN